MEQEGGLEYTPSYTNKGGPPDPYKNYKPNKSINNGFPGKQLDPRSPLPANMEMKGKSNLLNKIF